MSSARSEKITLREMVREDLDTIAVMETSIFSDPWPLSFFEDIFKDDHWGGLVAVGGEKIVGYACYLIIVGEAHLTNVAVLPEYRRKSIAKRLLDRILRLARDGKCEMVILEVRPSNKPAITFYEKAGFVEMYRRPKYYKSPVEDALVMVRWLKSGETDR